MCEGCLAHQEMVNLAFDQAIHRAGYSWQPEYLAHPYFFYRSNRMSDQGTVVKDGTVQNSIVSVNATIDSLFGAISSLEKRIEPVTISNIPNPESGETQVDSEVRVVQEIDSIDSRVREAVRQLLRLEERVKL